MIRILRFCFIISLGCLYNTASAQTLLILGDSLSAGYQMPAEQSWPNLIGPLLQNTTNIDRVINASISGDTTGNGLERLPALLTQYHPQWVLIELGANDGLRGFPPNLIAENLTAIIAKIKAQNAQALLMQILIPPNYGNRYGEAFAGIYPFVARETNTPLLPFFMQYMVQQPNWIMDDGLHPKPEAQEWIAQFVANEIKNAIGQQ